jgi:hypothetical protein
VEHSIRKKLALTSLTSGGRSVSIVRLRTEASEFFFCKKLKKYKSPGSNQILAELIQGRGNMLLPEIHTLIGSVWNKEELPAKLKESNMLTIQKNWDKYDCSINHGISLPSTSYKILTNILLKRLSPYKDEIIGYHQCGFRLK